MATPVLIDTDMGVDDAVAVTLALYAVELQVAGIASVEGNVSLDQATANVGRLLAGLQWPTWPPVGRGLSQPEQGPRAHHVHGSDGLGGIDLKTPSDFHSGDYLSVYEKAIEQHGSDLVILAIGPLTNLGAILAKKPKLLGRAGRIVVMGGAVWYKGNVTPHAEFNFHRDPQAASAVLLSGLPVTVVPLDVTRQVVMDESHVAHLQRGRTRGGQLLADMIRFPLEQEIDGARGRFMVHDATAVGVILWPQLFMRASVAIEVTTSGPQAGQCRPKMAKSVKPTTSVVISVQAADFMENLLEKLCQERFVV
ncbi:MAG TPA: nucleoside hydrolase [Phycisphaerae bacterium]|nr:nucleoside hydrolase [Phycisphaerae bacterium]